MGLALTTPVAQANITTYTWTGLIVDPVAGTVTIQFQITDSNGNLVRNGFVNLPTAAAATRIASVKAAIYSDLETQLSLTGTVT
jgi:hypothetical protein